MSAYGALVDVMVRGFNGAAALQRRKYSGLCLQYSHVSQLQWGRRSSAAEMANMGSTLQVILPRLQWGRRSSAAEISGQWSVRDGLERFNGAAALQRRKWEPGWWRWTPTFGFNGAAALQRRKFGAAGVNFHAIAEASMGPPLFSGGNDWIDPQLCRLGLQLQWGRRSSAAEMALTEPEETSLAALQWGRRSSAAEMSNSAGSLG